jgi:FKBP-type peptidyl-prolyl cis-trans isomerase FklB
MMKRLSSCTVRVLALAILSFAGCNKQSPQGRVAENGAPAAPTATLQSDDQKVSYGIGHNMGSSLVRDRSLTIDQAALMAGITDGLAKIKPRVPEAEIEAAFTALRQRIATEQAAAGEKQLAAGKAYLEKNKTKPGVKVTASGLQYEVLKSGTGPKPKATDTVKVHYHGTLIDGTVFDSSVQRNEPIEFPVTGVIQGWVEALQMMSVGDKWKLTIPPDIAYGPSGKGDIPPNSVLIFEVELLGIK